MVLCSATAPSAAIAVKEWAIAAAWNPVGIALAGTAAMFQLTLPAQNKPVFAENLSPARLIPPSGTGRSQHSAAPLALKAVGYVVDDWQLSGALTAGSAAKQIRRDIPLQQQRRADHCTGSSYNARIVMQSKSV